MRPEENQDPYTPPPRYKQRSGALVRVAIVAALLGAAGWGYMQYSQQPQSALVEPEQEQRVAQSGYDTGYAADPVTPAPSQAPGATSSDTPAQPSEPASSEPAQSDPPA